MTPTYSADARSMFGPMLAANPSWEAVVHASAEGLPIAWLPAQVTDVERLTQAAVALYQASVLAGFLQAGSEHHLAMETGFGQLQVIPREDGTLVLVFERTGSGPVGAGPEPRPAADSRNAAMAPVRDTVPTVPAHPPTPAGN